MTPTAKVDQRGDILAQNMSEARPLGMATYEISNLKSEISTAIPDGPASDTAVMRLRARKVLCYYLASQ